MSNDRPTFPAAIARWKTTEGKRAQSSQWQKWGPYLSERQWGTVREDYSRHGEAWDYLPHDHARSRAYRWGEDGIAGISDAQQRLCFAFAMWNGKDPILKERLFGLTNSEGNHGEDVKELYYYVDATPSHSYLRMLYKYPQAPYPYDALVEGGQRGSHEDELELLDTGVFDQDRYFDVSIEYAQGNPGDIYIRVLVTNRGDEPAELVLLPTLWFRNVWSWSRGASKPRMFLRNGAVAVEHPDLQYHWYAEGEAGVMFTENETNTERLHGQPSGSAYTKDAFHRAVVDGDASAVNPLGEGTKAAYVYKAVLPAGGEAVFRLRLSPKRLKAPIRGFDKLMRERRAEADAYYDALQKGTQSDDVRLVQRQALAGMVWSKQFYNYDVSDWISGDDAQPSPPPGREQGRNHGWAHLNNADVISMPDKWEYPWYAAWDLAFHCIPLALIDPEFSKHQLKLLTREWYQHPNGQIPAYEWAFDDVNPPVHAWATYRVFQIDRAQRGDQGDLVFLESMFHKLILNFTWWVNRKDVDGHNVFQGGFLGLDNIGLFDRSAPLPTGRSLTQADGTSWMAMYSLNLMAIALELAGHNPVYEDIATKFFEHFLHIAKAMASMGTEEDGLWDAEDRFYYDFLGFDNGASMPLKVRSMVGLIPLFAVETIEPELLQRLPGFAARLDWVMEHLPGLASTVASFEAPGRGERRLLSLLSRERLQDVLRRMLDEKEFLSPYGIRALSKHYEDNPYELDLGGHVMRVDYWPAESRSGVFGGNSNWRGPIWFPVNFLLVESLRRHHHYYGADFKVECPTGSGQEMTLNEVADELSRRLASLFLRDASGARPALSQYPKVADDPHFRDLVLFHEYFHGDTGRGVGASHQTGWTGLVAKLLQAPARAGAADE